MSRGHERVRTLSRRQMLKMGLLSGSTFFVPKRRAFAGRSKGLKWRRWGEVQSPATTPFVDLMPIPPTAVPGAAFAADDCPEDVTADANTKYYNLRIKEAMVSLHSELNPTPIWRYEDVNGPVTGAAAGPTFKVFMNEEPLRSGPPQAGSVIARFNNQLPPFQLGFGCPCMTVHFHGGHVEARSDGFPENIPELNPVVFAPAGLIDCEPPEDIESPVAGCDGLAPTFFDYCYHMRDVGFRTGPEKLPQERMATNWYHDHLFDFTGPNVYRGLAGMYLVFDEYDASDETGTTFPATNLCLPSGDYDIPLILQDKLLMNAGGLTELVYDSMDHDGFLGDKFMVNGKIQPYFPVERRKYRFRLMDASNARFYFLRFLRSNGDAVSFTQIGANGSLLNFPLLGQESVFFGPAEREDIVIDFSQFSVGEEIIMTNFSEQDDGRGPDGTLEDPDLLDDDEAIPMLKFIVAGDPAVPDVSKSEFNLPAPRRIEAIPQAELDAAPVREWKFDRRHGAWAVNGELADLEHASATPTAGVGEIWRFENGGGGWWHPIHVHLEIMRVLSRNGGPPLQTEAKEDTVILGGGDEVEVYFNFRDFEGPFVFHCHNIEHEDMRMMARFDVLPSPVSATGVLQDANRSEMTPRTQGTTRTQRRKL